jgi:hypothetical protein
LLLGVLLAEDLPEPIRMFTNENFVQLVGQAFQFFH